MTCLDELGPSFWQHGINEIHLDQTDLAWQGTDGISTKPLPVASKADTTTLPTFEGVPLAQAGHEMVIPASDDEWELRLIRMKRWSLVAVSCRKTSARGFVKIVRSAAAGPRL